MTFNKSPLDPCEYKSIELENGLKAQLIQNPYETVATVVLCLRVGGRENTLPGLSHLVEHVIHYFANDKYDKYEYANFVINHGGFYNAHSESDVTVYYFQIDNNYFEQALDRFTHLFINPKFNKSIITKEIQAIQSEYEMKSSQRILTNVMLKTLNTKHPHTIDVSGNANTLSDPNVIDHVKSFIKKYYGGNNMQLVIQSNRPIKQQEQLVKQLFSKIPNGITPIDSKESYIDKPRIITYLQEYSTRIHKFLKSIDITQYDLTNNWDKYKVAIKPILYNILHPS